MHTPLGRVRGPNILKTLCHMLLLSYKREVSFTFVKSAILQLNPRIRLHTTGVGTKWFYMPPDVMQREVNSITQDPLPPYLSPGSIMQDNGFWVRQTLVPIPKEEITKRILKDYRNVKYRAWFVIGSWSFKYSFKRH